jgi:hypothetical protein
MTKRSKAKKNPITLSRNAKIGIGVAVAAGIAVAIYYVTKASGTSASLVPVTVPNGGVGPSLPPVTAPLPSTSTTTPTSTTVTEANSGHTFNMHVNDTLVVVLDITAPTTEYTYSLTGTNLSAGAVTDLMNQMFQTWTATGPGPATIIYAPTGGTQNVQFNVVVT